jgi:hypothetical protein
MPRTLTRLMPICLAAALLAACNLPSSGSPAPTHTRATFPPTDTFTPTETVTPVEATITNPVGTITVTLRPTLEPASPQVLFQAFVKGGRVAYDGHPIDAHGLEPTYVCAMDAGWAGQICTPPEAFLIPTWLAWSPAGERLLISNGNTSLEIWTLGAGVKTLLEAEPGKIFLDPDWSPDGRTIAYVTNTADRKGDETPGGGELDLYDIFTVNVEDAKVSWLTANKAADSWSPRFSPDGSKLAYISARILKYPDGTTRPSTYQVTLQDLTDLTMAPVSLTTGEAYGLTSDSVLAWSQDGTQMLFSGKRLYVMNPDGSGVRQVGGTDYGGIHQLTWLPGGQAALVNEGLHVDLATGEATRLSLPFQTAHTQWVFPKGGAALQPLPAPTCAAGWTNLYAGATAIVAGAPTDPPNRVRSGPGQDHEVIYQVYPGTLLKVVEGPVCADGLVYWKVEYEKIPGGSGWTAEGDFTEYWLELYRP